MIVGIEVNIRDWIMSHSSIGKSVLVYKLMDLSETEFSKL
jgi:hypothetical protein